MCICVNIHYMLYVIKKNIKSHIYPIKISHIDGCIHMYMYVHMYSIFEYTLLCIIYTYICSLIYIHININVSHIHIPYCSTWDASILNKLGNKKMKIKMLLLLIESKLENIVLCKKPKGKLTEAQIQALNHPITSNSGLVRPSFTRGWIGPGREE